MKDLKYYLDKIYNEDERNLLPKDFDDYINDNFGSFEDFLYEMGSTKNDSHYFLDQAREELAYEYGEDEPTEYDIEERADQISLRFKEDAARDIFYSCIDLYERLGDPLTLYRAVSLPAKNLDDLENMRDDFVRMNFGIYWAYDYDGAVAHWGHMNGTQEFIFKAQVSADQVDWKETLDANMNPETGDEKEIRLYRSAVINLISIKDRKSKKIQEINMRVKA